MHVLLTPTAFQYATTTYHGLLVTITLFVISLYQQWSFDEVAPLKYHNKYDMWPAGEYEFRFLVIYPGNLSYDPFKVYTQPPKGTCHVYHGYVDITV